MSRRLFLKSLFSAIIGAQLAYRLTAKAAEPMVKGATAPDEKMVESQMQMLFKKDKGRLVSIPTFVRDASGEKIKNPDLVNATLELVDWVNAKSGNLISWGAHVAPLGLAERNQHPAKGWCYPSAATSRDDWEEPHCNIQSAFAGERYAI